MTYSPYLIANFATGLDKRLQPWLIPDDAQQEMLDGFVYRGVMSKREGYNYFAIGEKGGSAYRESRIVHTLVGVAMAGTINSSNKTFTLAGTVQIARGSITITGSTPLQVVTDDGLGNLTGAGTGTVNYLTGAISVTFTAAPTAGTVLITYSFFPDEPVMMVAGFITNNNSKQLIVADESYVNRYNPNTNILEDISPASAYNGGAFDFFSWTNYASATNTPRLLFSNNVDPIQQYDGSSVTDYSYTLTGITTLTASWLAQMKDRLILLRTTENGTIFPQRIRISGFGANSDVFDSTAIGAGLIDIPDGTWIQGAAFNRDDLIIFTEASTWVLRYTGNDSKPFVLDKIDESRGCDAAFSAITYLNRTSAASPRGLIMTDGYRVERQDEDIPDFSFDEVNDENFSLCFAGSVDNDKDHYLIYPTTSVAESKRILVTNYDEDNYAYYRLPLSCMGTYVFAYDITWNDLLIYDNWAQFAQAYGNWNSFAYTTGSPFSIGGGHHGEIWRLAVTESEDNPVRIYNITIIDAETVEITTDWNNFGLNGYDQDMGADFIYISGVVGMIEINRQQYPVVSVTNNNVFRVEVPDSSVFSTYVSGGVASRVIPFSATLKKFNPYVMQDKKVRCGWLYMYVDTTGTNLSRANVAITGITNTFPPVITTLLNHDFQTGNQIGLYDIGGMTQLNGNQYFITVLTPTSFSLNGIDATAYGAYTSGGFAAVPVDAKMIIDIITDDRGGNTQLNNVNPLPYQGNCTNMSFESGSKKWYKVFINQVGKFIQFRLRNVQAGAKINIHAMMPGFLPLGRLI
jgi:hypothetical protein